MIMLIMIDDDDLVGDVDADLEDDSINDVDIDDDVD